MTNCTMNNRKPGPRPAAARQRGLSLIVVMLILIVVSVLGVGGVQIAMMAERGTRNDRDLQLALQGAEAALTDAADDLDGLSSDAANANKRSDIFKRGDVDLAQFVQGCGSGNPSPTTKNVGLCALRAEGDPAWLRDTDFAEGANPNSVQIGGYTGRHFPAGAPGTQPARKPRYVIEVMRDEYTCKVSDDDCQYVYRVTAMGFGPNAETQAVLQMLYRNVGK